jgi:glycosyltransferase involved in cell wall biosynthesis
VLISVVLITCNEAANLGRALASVAPLVAEGRGEIVIVDSGSTDRTLEIAQSIGARVNVEEWRGFAAQKNSALDKAQGDWVLSLDADEELEPDLAAEILASIAVPTAGGPAGYFIPRKNHFLGRWIKHGGYWPDPKLRLFRRGSARFEDRLVHEDAHLHSGAAGRLRHALIHHSYPTTSDYIEHMNRYSSLGAEMAAAQGRYANLLDVAVRPVATFLYNYLLRLGFLDGHEGLLLHLHHAVYVSWKYAKLWEMRQGSSSTS